MKPFRHKTGRWAFQLGKKASGTGRRKTFYFLTESEAKAAIKRIQHERLEFGKSSVTAEERNWLQFLKQTLGDLSSYLRSSNIGVRPVRGR